MLTRREVVIEKPFRDRRYKDHRRKVHGALPRIDAGPPREYPHLVVKLKKLRMERDRQGKICQDNIKLVHRMAVIMRTKRLDNINTAPRGPYEPRSRASATRRRVPGDTTPSHAPSEDEECWGAQVGGSFLQQVTAEVERHVRPTPPGKLIQHRAPAGLCRVPRVGPPPSPQTPGQSQPPRRPHHRVPTITLPLSSPRPRRSPSPPTTASDRSSASGRRGRETTRLTPLPGLMTRRPSITASLPPFQPDNSSSAADDDDDEDDETEHSDEKGEDTDNVSDAEEEEEEEEEDEEKTEESQKTEDSDDHVSSVLLRHHPNITIDEASDDDFYGE